MELEHATIPPYLCAYYSLTPGDNDEIATTIRSVVIEEMLHMTIAANLLNALGGTPRLADPEFIPHYPMKLPLNIGHSLTVGVAPYSRRLVKDVFMVIESPEDPPKYPVADSVDAAQDDVGTIGQFYEELKKKLTALGDQEFVGDPARQVVDSSWFSGERLFPLRNVTDATRAIDQIIIEGEGTPESPYGPGGKELAHYFRFEQLWHGRHLERDGKGSYSYSGEKISYNPDDVWEMPENPRVADYAEGTRSRFMAETFSEAYTRLLHSLHRTFDGEPERLSGALGLMFEMRLIAQDVLRTGDSAGRPTGLCFEYWPHEPAPPRPLDDARPASPAEGV